MSVNKIFLIGNVGQDPEVTRLDSGVAVANFSLATSKSWKNKDGEKQTSTEWHRIVLWRGLAEVAEKYVKKGSQLNIIGESRTRKYEKDGNTFYITEVYGTEMTMIGKKPDDSPANNQEKTTAQAATFDEVPGAMNAPDDLPF